MNTTHADLSYPRDLTTRRDPLPVEGSVIDADGPHWMVSCGGKLRSAAKAVSCLVAPEAGDTVLLHHAGPSSYILAVLERPEASTIRLSTGHDTTLDVDGSLQIHASELKMKAPIGQFAFEQSSLLSRTATAQVDQLSVIGRFFRRVCEQFSSSSKTSIHLVEKSDILQCGNHDCRADQHVRVHAKHVFTSAEGLVRFDGEQIHMG